MAQSSELTLPTTAGWKTQIIEDVELQAIDAGVEIPPTAKGSDIDLKATALANALSVLTSNQVILDNDGNPNTAEGDQLDEIRASDGLPEVNASYATNSVSVTVTATAGITVPDGTRLLMPGAIPGKTVGTVAGVVTGSELAIMATTAGSAGNMTAGTKVRFFDPPAGLATEASIVATGTDGTDKETDAKKRRRILNRRQNPPRGGNWSHLRELALSSTNAIDDAFVYPALGGPGSDMTAVVAPWFNGGTGQSRVASAATVAVVQSALDDGLADGMLHVAKSAADEPVSLRMLLEVNPGNSSWIDKSPWPSSACEVIGVTTNLQFTVELDTDESPSVGKSIAIWSAAELGFRTAVIQAVTSLGSSQYTLTVNAWQGGPITVVSGLQVSPAAGNMTAWADKLLDIFGAQTPGEACESWQEPRSLRHPVESLEEPVGFGQREVGNFLDAFDELANADIESISADTPTTVTPSSSPNVLTLQHLSLGVL